MIIAGDVGGTKARIGLFTRQAGRVELVVSEQYHSNAFSSFEDLLKKFTESHSSTIKSNLESACFGLPGPVINGRVKVTNLPWEVAQSSVSSCLGVPKTKLVNDLVSTAAAIPLLESDSLEIVSKGGAMSDQSGSCAVIAPGTGLGHSLLHREGGWTVVLASEGGHANFAPCTDIEIELLKYLQKKLPHVSVESIVCGPGLVNIYLFLRDTGHGVEPEEDKLPGAQPVSASVIANRALAGINDLSIKSLELFCQILGAHCSNIGLTYLSTGGIYLGGGIPPKIAPFILGGKFMEGYLRKGKLRDRVEATPVFIIKDDTAALLGSAAIAATL
jgi:glucokinase